MLVAPHVVPVGHGGRGRGRAREHVLRAGDRREAVRRHGDQSAKEEKEKRGFASSCWTRLDLVVISLRRDGRARSTVRETELHVRATPRRTWTRGERG